MVFSAVAAVAVAVLVPTAESLAGRHRADRIASTSVPQPAHWWQAEGNAKDSVGSDDGTLKGATFEPGVHGTDQAFSFDGQRAQVVFNNVGGNRWRQDFTFSFFVKTTGQTKQAVGEKRPVCDAASFWDFRLSAAGLVQPTLYGGRGRDWTPGLSSTTSVNDGSWHAVALSRHGTTASLYIDGQLEATATTAHPVYLNNDARLRMGMSVCVGVDGARPFTGELDGLRIYHSALSQQQVQGLSRS